MLGSMAATAQRADQNAVTAAEDAFGTQTGTQSVGLYSLTDARGFNPQQAGNLRLEGLYYNQTAPYINQCLVRDTTMRVGIAAQSVAFPAPTGVADLRLYVPDGQTRTSAVADYGSFGEVAALGQAETALGATMSGLACVDYTRNFFYDEARSSANLAAGGVLAWRPSEATEVIPFWGVQDGHDHDVVPIVYTDGLLPPPQFHNHRLSSAPYTVQSWRLTSGGVLVRHALSPAWSVDAGLFQSREHDGLTFFDEFLSVLPDRSADRTFDIAPPLDSEVTSGELRLTRRTGDDRHGRRLELAIRGRASGRDYGGDALVDLGPSSLYAPPPPTLPPYATVAVSHDTTRQLDGALSYEERWTGRGSLAFGLMRSYYRRTIEAPGTAPDSDRTAPWLGSARFTAVAGPGLTIYGSYLQGLEDAQLAPTTATNRGQPPPATRTHQSDAGLRYAPEAGLSLILGAFEIDKSYFNLDDRSLYRRLGAVQHRGVEASATYAAGGVTLVAGGVWLRPHVERSIPEPGATGTLPLGPTPLTLTFNVDAAPASLRPFAASLAVNRRSGGAATADDRYRLAPITTVGLGLRYEAKWEGRALTIRLDAQNLTDASGLHVTTVGQVLAEPSRRYRLSVALDN
jgi:iron complex outermembrane recepter protein